jgi:hypothetical protein
VKWRSAIAAAFLRRFLQTQPSSPNGTIRIQTHHRRTWHVRHGLFSLEWFRVSSGGGKNSRCGSPSKHRVNGSNTREFALMLSVCQGKMQPTLKIYQKSFSLLWKTREVFHFQFVGTICGTVLARLRLFACIAFSAKANSQVPWS